MQNKKSRPSITINKKYSKEYLNQQKCLQNFQHY